MHRPWPTRLSGSFVALVAVVSLAVLANGAAALSAQPALTVTSPAPGTTVAAWDPPITVSASDSRAVNATATLVLDGTTRALGVAFKEAGGHWEGDGCDSWWVPEYDYTKATASLAPLVLADGSHVATVTWGDSAGDSNAVAWSFRIAAPPKAGSFVPANGAVVKGASPSVSSVLTDNGTIATASVSIDGSRVQTTYDAVTKTISGSPAAPLPDGAHTASVTATDAGGLASTSTWSFSTATTSTIVFQNASPSGGTTVTAWNPTISVGCTDTAVVSSMAIRLDGAVVPGTFRLLAGAHSGTITYPTASLTDGRHAVSVTATNNLGFSSTCAWTFGVASAPRLSAPSPASGAYAATLTPQLSVKVSENGDMDSWAMQVDGTPVSATYDPMLKAITGVPGPLTDEATHAVSVQATDAAGNGASYSWSFRTHASPPVLSGPSPAAGSAVPGPAPIIAVSASDVIGLAGTATMRVDGTAVPCSVAFAVTGGHWEDDGCDCWWVTDYDYTRATISGTPSALGNGAHTAVVTATNSGGSAATYTWGFTVASPPQVSFPSPAAGSWTTTRQPVVSANVAANSAIASATVTIDGIPASTVYDAANKVVKGTPLGLLADDVTHVAVATVQDADGQIGTLSWTFGVHSTSPVLTGQVPAAGSVLSVPDVDIAMNASDVAGLSGGPSVKLDGAVVSAGWSWPIIGWEWYDDGGDGWNEPVYDTTRGSASYAAKGLKDGTHTVEAQWAGVTGLRTSSSWSFKVASPPAFSSPSPANGGWAATLTSPVSVKASDNGTITAATVTIDGVAAPATYSAVTKTITALPASPLAPRSTHSVVAVATDDSGYSASYAWSFQTQDASYVGPAVWGQTPSSATTIAVANPRISVNASDPAGMASTAVMTVDGSTVPCTWSYVESGGRWVGTGCEMYWEPAYDYTRGTASFQTSGLSDGAHTLTATVRNSLGQPTTSSWSFGVAVPPSLSAASPTPGSAVATLVPTISFKVSENGVVATTSVSVDGVPIPCQYDPVAKTVTGQPLTPLADDTAHSVVATVTDGVGAVGTIGWSFNVRTGPPVFEGAEPETSTAVWNPRISLSAYDTSGFKPASAAMKLDGVSVSPSFAYKVIGEEWVDDGCEVYMQQTFDYTHGTVSYQPASLADGVHTVWAQVTNSAGAVYSRTWQFEVNSKPRLSDGKPSAGSTVATTTPAISAALVDNGTIATVSATIDGARVPASYDGVNKRVNVLPPPLLNDVDHRVVVTATDTAGNSADYSWTFHVQIFLAMTNPDNCSDCHTSVGHPTDDCSGCHSEDCSGSGCHGGHGILYFQPSECAGCHSWNGRGHADVTTLHTTTRDMTSCRPCHVASLTTEHSRYDSAGDPFTCNTCHKSTDSKVTTAIAAGRSDCADCHDVGAGGHVAAHSDVTLSAECLQCHRANLVDEHLSNTRTQKTALTCDACHGSSDPKIRAAIASGNGECTSCHATSHGDLALVHTATDIGSQGCASAGCHDTGDALALHASCAEGSCAVCHANPTRGDLTAGKTSAACGGCHSTAGVDYHKNMAVHNAPDSFETCGHCHHGWGSSPIKGPDVTRHAGGCATCHNATTDLTGLTTKCANCHEQDGTDFHTKSALYHTPLDAGSLGCARCHGTTDVRYVHQGVGCDVCHVTKGCSECHRMHNGNPGTALLSGVSCSRCHKTSGTDYHRSFDATHTFGAMDASCQASGCHSNTLVGAHQSFVGPGNRYPQYSDACALCHLNDDPSRVPANASADCSSCHGDISGGHQTLHDTEVATETIPGGTVKCGDCHSANLMTEHSKPYTSSSGRGCTACHPSPADSVTAFDRSTCAQAGCHAEGTADAVHGDIAAAHANTGGTCAAEGCHPGDLGTLHSSATTTTPEGARSGCLVCHSAGALPRSGSCVDCHGSSPHGDLTDSHSAEPASATITILGAVFGTHACSECHGSVVITTLHDDRCQTCHPTPRSTFGTWDRGCVQGGCHTASSTAPKHASIDDAHVYPSAQTACLASGCHDAGAITPFVGRSLADLHSKATTTVAGVSRSGCGICHGVGRQATNDCLTSGCHSERGLPHGYDAVLHTGAPNAQAFSIDGTSYPALACADCHSLELGVEHTKPSSAGDTGCSECHAILVGQLTPAWDRTTCAQDGCHTPSSAAPMHVGITTAHVRSSANDGCFASGCHADGSLAAIHSNATTTVAGVRETSCMVCHAAGVPPTRDCTVCHPDKVASHYDPAVHNATGGSVDVVILGEDFGAQRCADCHPSGDLAPIHQNGCATCHPSAADAAKPWDHTCSASGCHAPGGPKPPHADIDGAHTVSAAVCGGAGCHTDLSNAAAIHRAAKTTSEDVTLASCRICHAPGRETTTDCSACHNMASPHGDLEAVHASRQATDYITFLGDDSNHVWDLGPGGGIGTTVTCAMCHGNTNLLVVHSENCALCHAGSTPPARSFDTWDGGCSQGGCHTSYHDTASSAHDAEYDAGNCDGCHWIVPKSNIAVDATTDWCGGCHTLASDPTPPRTTCSASSAGAYLGSQTFTFASTDINGSGVAGTRFQLDSGAWTTGTVVAVSAPATGVASHVLSWYSTDKAGNVEATQSVTVKIAPPIASGGTLSAIGAPRLFAVPAGVTTLTVDLYGGMGGGTTSYGARLRTNIAVTPGQVLILQVGSRAVGATGGWGGGTGGNGYGGATGGGGSTSVGVLNAAVLAEAGGGAGGAGTSTGGPGGAYTTAVKGGNQPGKSFATGVHAGGGGGWSGGAYGTSTNTPGVGGTSHVAGNVYLTFNASGNTTGNGWMVVSW